ncbi:MAG: YceH family protein [Acidobacteriota bacterium]|nr:YceH family protein [Acidobacteriota bacterium]
MRSIRDLEPNEIRVLGALLEKEQATPEYYPMTVNALIAACNQKSNRDPVTSLTETEVIDALESLRVDVLAWRSDGARVERWSQSISRRLELDPEEKAILTLLMLRGPQTPGQLRSRSGRLHRLESLGDVEEALARLAVEDRELTSELPRRPGQKETRWAPLLAGDTFDLDAAEPEHAPQEPRPAASKPGLTERVAALEEQVSELVSAVENLSAKLES